jgi:hemoglobin-like flavoprotein
VFDHAVVRLGLEMGVAAGCCRTEDVKLQDAQTCPDDIKQIHGEVLDQKPCPPASESNAKAACADEASEKILDDAALQQCQSDPQLVAKLTKKMSALAEDFPVPRPVIPPPTDGCASEDKGSETVENEACAPSDSKPQPLTMEEIHLVEKSWVKVEGLGVEKVGVLLFKNIFELEPACLQLFSFKDEPGLYKSAKLKQHGTKVVQTVGAAIGGLRNLDALVPVLDALAVKHVEFAILPKSNAKHKDYYDVVGQALMKTLREGVGKDFTSKHEGAWTKVYSLVSETMIKKSIEVQTTLEKKLEAGKDEVVITQNMSSRKNKKKPDAVTPPPAITPDEISIIEKSWNKVEELGVEKVGVLLFKNIFEMEPACLQMFSFRDEPGLYKSAKLKKHGALVVKTVGAAVAGLRNLEGLVPVLEQLALKHVGYNILPQSNPRHKEFYGIVGQALLKTLRDGLGKDFTAELKAAWTKVYTVVSETMIAKSIEADISKQT